MSSSRSITYVDGEDMPEVTVVGGERREMIDKLLTQASELYGEGQCHFLHCFGQTELVYGLGVAGEGGKEEVELHLCALHADIAQVVIESAPDAASAVGFFMQALDPARNHLREAVERARS